MTAAEQDNLKGLSHFYNAEHRPYSFQISRLVFLSLAHDTVDETISVANICVSGTASEE